MFKGSKIISPKTGLQKKMFEKIFFCKNFFDCKIICLKTGLKTKIFWSKFFYGFKIISKKKMFEINFWWKVFYGCKIISFENRVARKNVWEIFFRKLFMDGNLFPRKIILRHNFLRKIFRLKFFFDCKIILSETELQEKKFDKNLLIDNFL
jgi:hypothetical protein